MAKKKILFVLAAVCLFAASSWAQSCTYDTQDLTINFKRVIPGLLDGKFTINSSGGKVSFSKGNLQYNSDTQKWQFAANQWDYVGDAVGVGNRNVTEAGIANNSGIVDLFGWVGTSSNWDDLRKYGITSSSATNNNDGYGTGASEELKSDWGTLMGTGWRTLTNDEWTYLLNTSNSSDPSVGRQGNRFVKAQVHGVNGLILLPDGWTQTASKMSGILNSVNSNNGGFGTISDANWTILAGEGCVFLPAAGFRNTGTNVYSVNEAGYYWSSTAQSAQNAYIMYYSSSSVAVSFSDRSYWRSVRLVRVAE